MAAAARSSSSKNKKAKALAVDKNKKIDQFFKPQETRKRKMTENDENLPNATKRTLADKNGVLKESTASGVFKPMMDNNRKPLGGSSRGLKDNSNYSSPTSSQQVLKARDNQSSPLSSQDENTISSQGTKKKTILVGSIPLSSQKENLISAQTTKTSHMKDNVIDSQVPKKKAADISSQLSSKTDISSQGTQMSSKKEKTYDSQKTRESSTKTMNSQDIKKNITIDCFFTRSAGISQRQEENVSDSPPFKVFVEEEAPFKVFTDEEPPFDVFVDEEPPFEVFNDELKKTDRQPLRVLMERKKGPVTVLKESHKKAEFSVLTDDDIKNGVERSLTPQSSQQVPALLDYDSPPREEEDTQQVNITCTLDDTQFTANSPITYFEDGDDMPVLEYTNEDTNEDTASDLFPTATEVSAQLEVKPSNKFFDDDVNGGLFDDNDGFFNNDDKDDDNQNCDLSFYGDDFSY